MVAKDIIVIINPNARKGRARSKAGCIEEIFKKAGRSVDIAFTSGAGHAEELALEACRNGYSTIVAAGGDGCVNEVINGVMRYGAKEKPSLGIIPIGRGNDYAWGLGIPVDIKKACRIILSEVGACVDVGVVESFENGCLRYFLNGNGYGFEPLVNFKAMEFLHVNGMASYVLAFIRILLAPPYPYEIHLETDSETVDVCTQQISICLGRRMGSAFLLAPGAEVDDGYFDLMYTRRPLSRLSLLAAAFWFLTGRHLKHTKYFMGYRTRRVSIRSSCSCIASHVDGEIVSYKDGRDFDVGLIPSAVYVFRPLPCKREK